MAYGETCLTGMPESITVMQFPFPFAPSQRPWILQALVKLMWSVMIATPLMIPVLFLGAWLLEDRHSGMPWLATLGIWLAVIAALWTYRTYACFDTRHGIFSEYMEILGSLGFILMEKERSDFELRALAMTDYLTKALNRRAFTMRADQEIAAAQRNGAPLALLMIDIDHFKQINDKYGHAAGDMVLAEVAGIIGGCIRKQDTVGRYGGEEFGVLLPATNQAGALVLAEKLRSAVAARQYDMGRETASVTISTGVSVCQATCTTCRSDINGLLDEADKALYQAKHDGRNRTAVMPVGCAMPMARPSAVASK
jgi:diguanylate cyclase (GGDEF)-like protein